MCILDGLLYLSLYLVHGLSSIILSVSSVMLSVSNVVS
jgi:hypothetical protein